MYKEVLHQSKSVVKINCHGSHHGKPAATDMKTNYWTSYYCTGLRSSDGSNSAKHSSSLYKVPLVHRHVRNEGNQLVFWVHSNGSPSAVSPGLHLTISTASIRVHPTKNIRCYLFYTFYQHMLIHPTTITMSYNIFMQEGY